MCRRRRCDCRTHPFACCDGTCGTGLEALASHAPHTAVSPSGCRGPAWSVGLCRPQQRWLCRANPRRLRCRFLQPLLARACQRGARLHAITQTPFLTLQSSLQCSETALSTAGRWSGMRRPCGGSTSTPEWRPTTWRRTAGGRRSALKSRRCEWDVRHRCGSEVCRSAHVLGAD